MNHMHKYLRHLAIAFILFMFAGMATNESSLRQIVSAKDTETSAQKVGNTQVYFEENKGQFDKRVNFFARGTSGYELFLTSTEAVYVVSDNHSKPDKIKSNKAVSYTQINIEAPKRKSTAVYMTLKGANPNAEFIGSQLLEHRTNYFRGSDESSWRTNIPNYKSVRTNQIYDGIDVIWHGRENGGVQPDFVVHPNADLNQIQWKIEGAKDVELTSTGDLVIKTEYSDIKQIRPRLYQESNNLLTEVGSKFLVQKNADSQFVKIEIDNSNQYETEFCESKLLTSELAFSTFLGGSGSDNGEAIAIDAVGNSYVTGVTRSPQFPTTPGPLDPSLDGLEDVFVTKLNATGSALVYSTYLGGNETDAGNDIAVDTSGNVYVVGRTVDGVIDFPTTIGSFSPLHNGTNDAFVTKINPTGSALIYSTFIGGTNGDQGYAIAVDTSGSAYITGLTFPNATGSAFPTTNGAFDTTQNGILDAFVTKLNPTGSALVFSTFLGGNASDFGTGIAVDNAGNTFLTGRTGNSSIPFPTTAGAFDTTQNGNDDVFVTKLNASGSALVYSTFLGGSSNDYGYSIAVNNSGNSFITGSSTNSQISVFPTTAGAFSTTHNGLVDAFVSKLSIDGSALVFSTFLGGSNGDTGTGIKVDNSDNVYVLGLTDGEITSNFPTTIGAYDTTYNAYGDTFVSKFNRMGSNLIYSTFIGGSDYDYASDFSVDVSGNTYLTGNTSVSSTVLPLYPTTNGVFSPTYNGGQTDAFVTKLTIPQTRSVVFDFDGDGKTDISIYRPSLGQWWYSRSSDNGTRAFQFGTTTDKIAPADYTGDGKTDIATFTPSTGFWNILRSEDSTFYGFPFGANGDIAAPADFDGDGKADPAIFRSSSATWFISKSSGGTTIQQFGAIGDKPAVADFDGDGKADLSIYRVSLGQWWRVNSSDGSNRAFTFGTATDKPMQGDYTGDGKADVAFFRPTTGEWFVLRSDDFSFYAFPFGAAGDIPASGDYDGDGRFDPAVFRPTATTWFLNRSTAGIGIVGFGANGDSPVANAFVP
jgi:hypothetical protein